MVQYVLGLVKSGCSQWLDGKPKIGACLSQASFIMTVIHNQSDIKITVEVNVVEFVICSFLFI